MDLKKTEFRQVREDYFYLPSADQLDLILFFKLSSARYIVKANGVLTLVNAIDSCGLGYLIRPTHPVFVEITKEDLRGGSQ
jgi:hypothetical protein